MRVLVPAGVVVAMLVAAACGGDIDTPGQGTSGQGLAEGLVGRNFISTSVSLAGESRSLHEGPVRVWFLRPPQEQDEGPVSDSVVIGWTSGRNDYSGPFDISDSRLQSHISSDRFSEGAPDIMHTAMGCETEMSEQDAWLEQFFGEGPRWAMDGRGLILSTSDIVIELEEG